MDQCSTAIRHCQRLQLTAMSIRREELKKINVLSSILTMSRNMKMYFLSFCPSLNLNSYDIMKHRKLSILKRILIPHCVIFVVLWGRGPTCSQIYKLLNVKTGRTLQSHSYSPELIAHELIINIFSDSAWGQCVVDTRTQQDLQHPTEREQFSPLGPSSHLHLHLCVGSFDFSWIF